ncbi:response regulator [Kordia algicida OT-1]|uniref:Receiver component of a two-component response regulator n=1 Tax=Kordia algicida OT-1 TaxID=391587 RepID=A9DNF6_9FLAO|nr:response regulator [Kordia algicida]EDP97179.1 Receiver component of a two-component response regulator [Kordia algicida OT-1]
MFKKILVAEDLKGINEGIVSFLNENLKIEKLELVQYCDDAYLKYKKAILDQEPYDLLITDLSFEGDYREQKITSGDNLAMKIREEDTNTKIIVYSVEKRFSKIRKLIQDIGLNGYVCKGRTGLDELLICIKEVYKGEIYLSPEVRPALTRKDITELSNFDIEILKHLSEGHIQKDIARLMFTSTSSVEKRLNALKIVFRAKNTTHLVSIIKDLGLI